MMQSDVKAASLNASGNIYNGRVRVKGLLVIPGASAGSVTILDGGSSGTTLMTIATLASGTPFNVLVPGEGVICYTSAYATISNASIVAYYG